MRIDMIIDMENVYFEQGKYVTVDFQGKQRA